MVKSACFMASVNAIIRHLVVEQSTNEKSPEPMPPWLTRDFVNLTWIGAGCFTGVYIASLFCQKICGRPILASESPAAAGIQMVRLARRLRGRRRAGPAYTPFASDDDNDGCCWLSPCREYWLSLVMTYGLALIYSYIGSSDIDLHEHFITANALCLMAFLPELLVTGTVVAAIACLSG